MGFVSTTEIIQELSSGSALLHIIVKFCRLSGFSGIWETCSVLQNRVVTFDPDWEGSLDKLAGKNSAIFDEEIILVVRF